MRGVYRDVASGRRLLPRERDVVTGRLTGSRDDKGRRDDAVRPRRPRGRTVAGAGLAAAVILVGGGLAARALLTDGDRAPSAVTGSPTTTTTTTTAVAPPTPSEAPATAISLEYVGGRLVRQECSDASGKGECSYFPDPGSISLYCTADGCTLYHYGTGPIDGPLRLAGRTDAETDGCQQTSWTMDLSPSGVSRTEGVSHPARIVGTVTAVRPAELLPDGTNCLGAVQEYRYDATPS